MFIILKLYVETGANHFQVLLVHVGPYILIENDHGILFPLCLALPRYFSLSNNLFSELCAVRTYKPNNMRPQVPPHLEILSRK